MTDNLEELWDCICSDLGILQDKKKKDLIREYGRRVAANAVKNHKLQN